MRCEEARVNLSMALDGELADPRETFAHTQDCADCRAYRERLAGADKNLGEIAREMLPTTPFKVAAPRRRISFITIFGSIAALVLLSIGAIAINVNVRRPEPQEVFLLGSQELAAGEPGRVRLHVRDGVTHEPIAGARIYALAKTNPPIEKLLESDAAGDVAIEFDTPENVTNVSIEVRVTSKAGRDRLTADFKVRRMRRLYLATDKPVYQPGQEVHARLLACAANTMRPVAGEKATVTIEAPGGTKLFRRELATSEFGIVGFDFPLAAEPLFGNYLIRAEIEGVTSERSFEVKRYELPKFRVTVAGDQPWAAPGATIHGKVDAAYFFGERVDGTVRVTSTVTGMAGTHPMDEGRLTNGVFRFQGRIPQDARDGSWVEVTAEVMDGAGHVESRIARVRVATQPLVVSFVPDGAFSPQVRNRCYVVVARPDGAPVPATIEGDWKGETDDSGVTLFEADIADYAITVRAKDGSGETKAVFSGRQVRRETRGFALRVDHPIVKAGQTLQIDAICQDARGTVLIDVMREDQVLLSRRLEIRDGRGTLSLDLGPELAGELVVRGCRVLSDGNLERDLKRVVVEPPQGLQVRIMPGKPEVRPGEEMPVDFEITDAKGTPIRSAMTVGVVDAAVFAVRPTKLGLEEVRVTASATALATSPGSQRDPLLASFTLPAKEEFFRRSADKFNAWVSNAAVACGILLALAGWLYLVVRLARKGGLVMAVLGFIIVGLGLPLVIFGSFTASLSARRLGRAGGDPIPVTSMPMPGEIPGGSHGEAAPAVREIFPETLYWNAELITDDQGRAKVTLPAADSITSWTISAGAVAKNGRLGGATADLKVFCDFFVDLDLPVELTEGDRIVLPVAVHNHSPKARKVSVEFSSDAGIVLEDESIKTLEVAADSVTAVRFRVRAAAFGKPAITVRARGEGEDAIKRTIEVRPDGREVPLAVSDRVQGTKTFSVEIPDGARAGASSVWLKVYPSGTSELLAGLEQIVRLPTGCFEQSSSATYPNILTALYLKETGRMTPEVAATLDHALALGYQKLLTFEVPGGFALYPQDAPSSYLTAYAVLILNDFSKVYPTDPAVLARAVNALEQRRQSNGGWIDERGGPATTAYVAWALAEAGRVDSRASNLLSARLDEVTNAYELALMANALVATQTIAGQVAVEKLAKLVTEDAASAAWKVEGRTVVGSHGETAQVEATALAAMAMSRGGRGPLADKALTSLVRARGPHGGWHSTQSTILALKSLLEVQRGTQVDGPVAVGVAVNGAPLPAAIAPLTREDASLRQVEITRHLVPGRNTIDVNIGGGARYSVQVAGKYVLPWASAPAPERHLGLTLTYDKTSVAVGETVVASLKMTSEAAKGTALIAEVGLPPGFEVEESELQGMVERKAVDRWERSGRSLVFYLPAAGETGTRLTYRLRPRFVLEAKTPPSRLYEYYAPGVVEVSAPRSISVR